MGQQRRRKSWLRERVVAELRNGPIENEKGRVLQVLAARVGHDSSMSVGNVIRVLEAEGNATRMTAKDGVAPRGPCFKNMAAHPDVEELQAVRLKLAGTEAALAEAKEVINALGVDLKAERKHRGKIEDEAVTLSLHVEELKAEIKAISESGLDTSKVRVVPAEELWNDRSRRAIDQLMRAVPTANG